MTYKCIFDRIPTVCTSNNTTAAVDYTETHASCLLACLWQTAVCTGADCTGGGLLTTQTPCCFDGLSARLIERAGERVVPHTKHCLLS